ncbi:hypothetical protein KAU08_11650 [bacterium]|nr:hypothetical protein [bacterium]
MMHQQACPAGSRTSHVGGTRGLLAAPGKLAAPGMLTVAGPRIPIRLRASKPEIPTVALRHLKRYAGPIIKRIVTVSGIQ